MLYLLPSYRVSPATMSSSDDEAPPLALPLEAAQRVPQVAAAATNDTVQPTLNAFEVHPVPVTLITGYLGAGKTTLVNYILTAKHGCRCAVLLNEIGESADVERALVKEPEGQAAAPLADWVELENGCICCSSKNDMVKALESLMQQRDKFDFIVIETTGLANPGPVAAALWTDSELESSICLDVVVTVVDAKNIMRQLSDLPEGEGAVNEAQQQLAFADVVLLNKVDLVGEADVGAIRREIASVNADAQVLPCTRCEVELRHILSTGIYSKGLEGARAADGTAARTAAPGGISSSAAGGAALEVSQQGGSAGCGSAHAADGAQGEEQSGSRQAQAQASCGHVQEGAGGEGGGSCSHPGCSGGGEGGGPLHQCHLAAGSRVCTVCVVLRERPFDLHLLRHWLDDLLWEERSAQRADVFRVKALLWVAGSVRKHVCQGVYDIYDVVEGPEWGEGEERCSKVVLIGRRLVKGEVEAQLRRCLAQKE